MLGNEVVDLRDPDSQPESFRPRFDARVFTAEERRAISRDRDPLARRWAHWAAKGAASRLARCVDPGFVFAPGRFSVQFEAPSSGAGGRTLRQGFVQGLGENTLDRVEVRSIEFDGSVHVVALPIGGDWGAVDCRVERLDEGEEGSAEDAVRDLAIRGVARNLGIEPNRLSISGWSAANRNRIHSSAHASGWKGGPPREAFIARDRRDRPIVELDGASTSLSLSFSQHGRVIGYAMTPRVEIPVQNLVRHQPKTALGRSGTVIF